MSALTLLEAKAHLRIIDSDDDGYIQNLIDVAQAQAEEITSRFLEQKQTEFYLYAFSEVFELPIAPLVSVDSIEYYSKETQQYETLGSSFYAVDATNEPARIRLDASFDFEIDRFHPLKVTYTAGYATAPAPLKQWMLMRIATLYENREEVVIGTITSDVMNDYNNYLLLKYRLGRL